MIRVVVVVATVLGVVLAPHSLAAGQGLQGSPLLVTDEAAVEPPPQLSPVAAALNDDDGHHHGWWGGDWDWWWIVMAPMMLLFWGGVIALVIWLVRQNSGGMGRDRGQDGPLEIARARYARGEINKDEFEQIRSDLGRG